MSKITFFSKPSCRLCPQTAIDLGKLCAKYGIELLIQTVEETQEYQLPGFPSALITKDVFNTDNDILIVGADMVPKIELIALSK